MTVFTTHSLKSAATSVWRTHAHLLFGLWLCLALAPAPALAVNTEITQLRVERGEDSIFLSALVRFELPAVVEDALTKGIPLFFVVETDIYRDRWYWTDQQVASAARTLRLAYQPLTRKWRVNIVPGLITSSSGLRANLNQNYETLAEAMSAIQRVARWNIAETSDLLADAEYRIALSFRLDLSQLPRPFQIGVSGQREWTISAQLKERLKLVPPTTGLSPEAGVEDLK